MNNFRLFIGIALSDALKPQISAIMDRMAAGLPFRKWTHPDDLHVTLHFLGDTPENRIDAIRNALAGTAAGTAPLTLSLIEPGTFGPPQAPRILWLGLDEPESPGSLARLQQAVAPGLKAAGCALEDRPFRAHLTLARNGGAGCSREAVRSAWQDASAGLAPESRRWTAGGVTLFRSHLGRRPSYERIGEFPFQGH